MLVGTASGEPTSSIRSLVVLSDFKLGRECSLSKQTGESTPVLLRKRRGNRPSFMAAKLRCCRRIHAARLVSHLVSRPQPSGGSFFGLRARAATRKSQRLTSGPTFCHSAPMETHAFGFRLPANAPEGQKRFPISSVAGAPLEYQYTVTWIGLEGPKGTSDEQLILHPALGG